MSGFELNNLTFWAPGGGELVDESGFLFGWGLVVVGGGGGGPGGWKKQKHTTTVREREGIEEGGRRSERIDRVNIPIPDLAGWVVAVPELARAKLKRDHEKTEVKVMKVIELGEA